jgi:hypothetical protein
MRQIGDRLGRSEGDRSGTEQPVGVSSSNVEAAPVSSIATPGNERAHGVTEPDADEDQLAPLRLMPASPPRRLPPNHIALRDPALPDWYGNIPLHHMCAPTRPDHATIRMMLTQSPESARHRNQFGRLPLHYCVDRNRSDVEVIRLLLSFYPEAAISRDVEGFTPYDLAVKWKQDRDVLLVLLEPAPHQDWPQYLKAKYGIFAGFASCILSATSSSRSAGQGVEYRYSRSDEIGEENLEQRFESIVDSNTGSLTAGTATSDTTTTAASASVDHMYPPPYALGTHRAGSDTTMMSKSDSFSADF